MSNQGPEDLPQLIIDPATGQVTPAAVEEQIDADKAFCDEGWQLELMPLEHDENHTHVAALVFHSLHPRLADAMHDMHHFQERVSMSLFAKASAGFNVNVVPAGEVRNEK